MRILQPWSKGCQRWSFSLHSCEISLFKSLLKEIPEGYIHIQSINQRSVNWRADQYINVIISTSSSKDTTDRHKSIPRQRCQHLPCRNIWSATIQTNKKSADSLFKTRNRRWEIYTHLFWLVANDFFNSQPQSETATILPWRGKSNLSELQGMHQTLYTSTILPTSNDLNTTGHLTHIQWSQYNRNQSTPAIPQKLKELPF